MATLRPPLDELDRLAEPLNDGELRVARKLAELDDSWTVYVQPRLAQDIPDFVALHPRHGACAIEVKDWSVGGYRQADDGSIECMTGGAWQRTAEQPRYQAFRYRSTIYEHFFALPDDAERPTQVIRAVLVLPQWSTAKAERLFEKPAVTPSEQTVRVFGGEVLQGPAEKLVRATCPPPNAVSMERLRRHLVESDAVREAREPAKLSEGAKNIASNPSRARRRRVRGPAGCGKSFGLAARAARLADEQREVLVLTFNTTLANYLSTLVSARCRELGANRGLVTCTPFHSFCRRVVEDAEQAVVTIDAHDELEWHDAVVLRAREAYESGHGRRFDAVLIDEGQDFTLEWWTLLREHVVRPDGEMLLVADPTQDVYGKKAWTDEESMRGAYFNGPWTELKGSYRMPADLVPLANRFAATYVDGERLIAEVPADHSDISGASTRTIRHWENLQIASELGTSVGHEVVRLLTAHPDLNPNDVVFLCEHHRDGLDAVRVIEAAGFAVHHIFAAKDEDKARRKRRFWPDAPGVKGCTVHSFKGWETPALVMGIGRDAGSARLAYVAMTRVKISGADRPAYLSVINSDLTIAPFQSVFTDWTTPSVPLWEAPRAVDRVG
jgi:Nuclease-related domain/AAA domain